MAEIIDTLKLDIDQALRDVQRVEQALDRALAPVELRVDDSSIRRVEDSLQRVESAARETTGQVRLTADEYREVARAVELGVDPARAIARATGEVREQANLAEADFRDVAAALDISEDQARDLAREILEAQQAATRLEDAARDVARQLDLSEDEADQLASGLRRADRAADDINTRTGTLVGTFGNLRGVAVGVAGILATIGLGQGISLAVRGIQAALGQFQALNESINAVKVTFGLASNEIFKFGETSAQSAGLSAQAFQQAVVPIGGILRNFGFDAGEAADASIILVQRAADLASVYNVDVADALLSINSALVGQVEPLRRFGAEISVARVEAFLLASGMVASKDAIDQTALVQGRIALILQDTNRAAGDFANTSGELANAQRSAAAETQEFAASVGEDLAPAMAELVSALPGVLDGLTQLVPLLAGGADSAADFFDELGKGGNVREVFATIAGGIEAATTPLGFLGESASIVFDTFRGDLDAVSESTDRLETQLGQLVARGIGVTLAKALDQGADSIDAVGDALSKVSQSTVSFDVFTNSFRDFAIQAELSEGDLFQVAIQMLANAEAAELTADEIAFLESIFRDLGETLDDSGRANEGYLDSIRGIDDGLSGVTTRFTTFSGDLETASANITTTLRELADDSAGQQERLAEALDPFAELPEQIELSAAEATAAIVAQFEAIAAFEANVIRLAADAPLLAAELFSKGPAAADLVDNFLDNDALAAEAESALRGVATAGVTALTDQLETDLVALGLDAGTAAKFAALFSNPNVITEVTDAGVRAGASGVGGFRQGLLDEAAAVELDARTAISAHTSAIFAQEQVTEDAGTATAQSFFDGIINFDPLAKVEEALSLLGFEVDLHDEGLASGASYIGGMQEAIAARQDPLKETITNTLHGAIQQNSPPQLFVDAGIASGDAFWSGFEQANLTLRTPAIPITGSIATAVTGQTAGGVNVNLNINNPSVNDAVSDAARLGQIASSIATTYRSVT